MWLTQWQLWFSITSFQFQRLCCVQRFLRTWPQLQHRRAKTHNKTKRDLRKMLSNDAAVSLICCVTSCCAEFSVCLSVCPHRPHVCLSLWELWHKNLLTSHRGAVSAVISPHVARRENTVTAWWRHRNKDGSWSDLVAPFCLFQCVCVCVCVWERMKSCTAALYRLRRAEWRAQVSFKRRQYRLLPSFFLYLSEHFIYAAEKIRMQLWCNEV